LWPGSSDPFAVESEVSLATDPRSQMNIFGHDRHPLGMDGAQVGVLKEPHKIRFCCLLQSKHCMALEAQVTLHSKPSSDGTVHI